MILTTHGNRRVPSTSVKITSGGIREVRIGRYRARSEPWFVVARKRKASAYSAAPREKTDLSTNYQSTNYQKQTKGTSGETPSGERGMEEQTTR